MYYFLQFKGGWTNEAKLLSSLPSNSYKIKQPGFPLFIHPAIKETHDNGRAKNAATADIQRHINIAKGVNSIS